MNGTGTYKSEKQSQRTPPWDIRIQESINNIREEPLAEIKRDELKTQNMKRKKILRKYNRDTKKNLNQVTEELK
jgi:Fic family protein